MATKQVQLTVAPRLTLVTDKNRYARTTYIIVGDDKPDTTPFMLMEREPKDKHTSTVRAVNYDPKYYAGDHIAVPDGGNLYSNAVSAINIYVTWAGWQDGDEKALLVVSSDGVNWTTITLKESVGYHEYSINGAGYLPAMNKWLFIGYSTPTGREYFTYTPGDNVVVPLTVPQYFDSLPAYSTGTSLLVGGRRTTDLVNFASAPANCPSNPYGKISNRLWGQTSGHLVYSDDDGVSWNIGETLASVRFIVGHGQNLLAGGYLEDYYRSSDGGSTWTNIGPPSQYPTVDDRFFRTSRMLWDGQRYLALGKYGGAYEIDWAVISSTDEGTSWNTHLTTHWDHPGSHYELEITDFLSDITFDGTNYVVVGGYTYVPNENPLLSSVTDPRIYRAGSSLSFTRQTEPIDYHNINGLSYIKYGSLES